MVALRTFERAKVVAGHIGWINACQPHLGPAVWTVGKVNYELGGRRELGVPHARFSTALGGSATSLSVTDA